MKYTTQKKRNSLVNAAVWSVAVLAILAIGLFTFFGAASKKEETKLPKQNGKEKTVETEAKERENSQKKQESVKKPAETQEEKKSPVIPKQEEQTEKLPDEKEAAYYPDGEDFECRMPVNGTVSKDYTEDIAVYSLTMNDYRVHTGIDIDAPVGTKVNACAAGTVERIWNDPFEGTCVMIDHGGDIKSLYANLSPDLPKNMEAGVTVNAGDVIGGIGETMITEMADSAHLHFSMRKGDTFVDPMEYIVNYTGTLPEYDE